MSQDFGHAGQRLYDALSSDDDPFSLGVLVVEACRIADRLEQLNSLLRGDVNVWARVVTARDGDLELRVDNALQEARQQATVLRQLLAEIRRQKGAAIDGGYDPLDDL